jgi:hypothetical protein
MQLPAEYVLPFEFAVPMLLFFLFGVGHLLKKRIVKATALTLALIQMVVVAMRPADYNSDTWNYSAYIDSLSQTSGMEFLLLTKLEPLHLLLAATARDFHLWLLLDTLVASILLFIIVRKAERIETIAVVFGTSLPLMSSSVRFAVSLMSVACVLLVFRRACARFVAASIAGGLTHVSNLIAGVVQKRRWILTWGLLAAFFGLAFAVASVLQRAGVSEEGSAKPAGMRSLACLLGFIFYLRAFLPQYRRTQFRSDLLSALGIFALSFFLFPVLNRWLILLLVIVAVDADAALDSARVPRAIGRFAALGVYAALVVPFLYSVGRQVMSGEWFVVQLISSATMSHHV